MCNICLRNPCDARCPNSEDPEPLYSCGICGEGIFDGDHFYDSPEGYICEQCITDMTVTEFMELIGETFKIAEVKGW